ncbi:MAG: hypothetical protein ABI988_14700 [Nitrospirota bacterium]
MSAVVSAVSLGDWVLVPINAMAVRTQVLPVEDRSATLGDA